MIGMAWPAFAQVGVGVTASSSASIGKNKVQADANIKVQTQLMTKIKSRGVNEINRRINGLNRLSVRVRSMAKVSAAEKASLAASVQSEIASLTALKAKITADTDLVVLRADVKSITQSYRIYALIIPAGTIASAADRVISIADSMSMIGEKLQVRISEAQSAGKDIASLQTAMIDYNAQIAEAKVQAQAAITVTAALTPDNGDDAKFKANNKALHDARANVRAGSQDLKDARQDAKTIIQGLKAMGLDVSASASGTTTVR